MFVKIVCILQLSALGAFPLVEARSIDETGLLSREVDTPVNRVAWPKLWFYNGVSSGQTSPSAQANRDSLKFQMLNVKEIGASLKSYRITRMIINVTSSKIECQWVSSGTQTSRRTADHPKLRVDVSSCTRRRTAATRRRTPQ